MQEINQCFFSISQRCIHGNIIQLEIPLQICNVFHGGFVFVFFGSSEEQTQNQSVTVGKDFIQF